MTKNGFLTLLLVVAASSYHVTLVSSFVVNKVRPAGLAGSSIILSSSSVSNEIEIPEKLKLWKEPVPEVQVVDCMPPPLEPTSKQYYLLRHGQSTANVDEVISSDRSTLAYTNKHGLTETGYQQGRDSAQQLVELLSETTKPGDTVVLVSSPFARARQTAQACLDGLQQDIAVKVEQDLGVTVLPDIYYHDLLLERSFGRLDNEAIYTYAYVWPLDKMNVTHTAFDVESVAAVCTRLHRLIDDLEQVQFTPNDDKTTTHVVCVSHADVLQIAQLYAAHVPNVGEFSSYRFANGEVRPLHIGTGMETLPDAAPLEAPQRGTGM